MGSQTYEITFLGQAGSTLLAEFDDCEVTVGPGTTTLRAVLPDQGALSGLMQRITAFGLDVIDVSLVALPQGHDRPDLARDGCGAVPGRIHPREGEESVARRQQDQHVSDALGNTGTTLRMCSGDPGRITNEPADGKA